MIIAEMIYADARELLAESHKKRSLFEMMDDDYLAELDDSKFVHSMKMMLEAGFGDADQANSDNSSSGDRRPIKPAGSTGNVSVEDPQPLSTSDSDDGDVSVEEPPPLSTSDSDDGDVSVEEPPPLFTSDSDDGDVSVEEPPPLSTSDSDDNVEPVDPGDKDVGGNVITVDGSKYYDGLKYLNNISDEMPVVAAESRLSLIDLLYA